MPQQPLAPFALGLAALLLAGCGGSDTGGGGLELVSISVQDGQVWEINRPIQFTFSEPVAFGSVNSSSISVTTLSGKPALGEYRSKGANVVEFQPRCPTQGDLSDAGLEPGGVTYQVVVVGSDVSGGISVTSTAGGVMVTSQKRTFVTPVSTNPSQVFFDVKFGAPGLIVRDLGETTVEATYMQLGAEGDPAKRVYLADAGPPLGIVLEESDLLEDDPLDATIQLAPFNKYAASDGKFSLVLEFDQPVSPAAANISADRLVLQYFDSDASAWVDLDATVTLVKNCTTTGARVRIEPIGVIPPGAEVRLRISSAFQDIVGQTPNLEATAFEFPTAPPPLFNGSQAVGDDVFEPFDVSAGQPGSFEDPAPTFAEPLADWSDGALAAVFDFIGTGGPGGDFDLLVEEGSPLLIDTDGTVPVFGGPGFVIAGSQNIVNGVLNVRHLLVEEGALIRAEGNNALRIYATGTVTIAGRIDASGFDAVSVVQLASANLPEPGSLGACGGGRGGTGSPLTTSSSPKGGDGFGFQNAPGGGGVGGETGYAGGANEANRRPGGGGGGFYALNVAVVGDADECASLTDQDCLNGEPGNNGAAMGLGAISGASPPKGGALGPTVFIDGDLTNDFWGTRLVPAGANGVGNPATDQFVKGELLEPQAGPGGGGGGDNVKGTSFPPLPFKPTEDIKGCGGAGGGGSVQIIALQEIVFGPAGAIVADGGWGGRGESTGGINNMGGASGAGAGGHVVLQSAKYLDFSQVNTALLPPDTFNTSSPSMDDPTVNTAVDEIKWAFVSARGGRGGPGNDNQFSEGICAGGDGGMGVIQLHVPEPVEVSGLNLVYPRIVPPGGTWDDLAQEAVPNAVDADLRRLFAPNPHVLVPSVSARSRARSTFIPLGGAAQNSFSGLGQVMFRFGGIDVSDPLGPTFGQVLSTNSVVDDEPELISQTTASIDPVGRVVTFDASFLLGQTSGDVPDETFLREPALLRSAKLTLEDGVDVGAYTVAEASFDEGTNVLTLTLDNETDGDPLSAFVAASTTARLFPRSFRVRTQLALDGLPASASVTIRFQGVAADIDGAPDEGQIAVPKQVPGAPTWTSDIAEFNAADLLLPVDYFRFEVLFDIDANGSGLSANSPKPQLEFLRVALRY